MRILRGLRRRIVYDFICRSYGKKKLKLLNEQLPKNSSHSYTAFFRSPIQTEVLLGQCLKLTDDHFRKKIKIFVFAASNGSEVYTLAAGLLRLRRALDFEIIGSDIQPDLIEKAASGIYSFDEIDSHNLDIQRFDEVFAKKNDAYHVRPEIKKHCTFTTIDLLSQDISMPGAKADLILAQNVFCHMPHHDVRRAFANIMNHLMTPGILAIGGMPLDLRVELTKAYELKPLSTKVRAIHQEARQHIPEKWWRHYWGIEPYSLFSAEKSRRYTTIFCNQKFRGKAWSPLTVSEGKT